MKLFCSLFRFLTFDLDGCSVFSFPVLKIYTTWVAVVVVEVEQKGWWFYLCLPKYP